MSKRKMRLLMCADDPDTILSYGLLSDMLIDKWHKYYDIDYCSLQYQMGKPIPRRNEKGEIRYVKYPAHNKGERQPTFLPWVIKNTRPDIFWTNFDVQHYLKLHQFVSKEPMWIGWVPWDNYDTNQIPRAQNAFKPVDLRVAISRFGYDFLNSHGVRMDDYVYNIVDTEVFKPLPPNHEDIERFRMSNRWYRDGMKILLFVGRPNWRKRILHLLRICQELRYRGHKDFKIFFHSNIEDPAATGTNIPELINALGIEENVVKSHFHWDIGIDKKDLNVLYNLATLYLAPHGGEGFGMPIAESMAAGTPFLASDYCTTHEFAGENQERGFKGPIMYPQNPDGSPIFDKGVIRPYPLVNKFADLIEQVWDDDNRLRAMGKNGVKWVNENCTKEVVANKWMKILNTFNINFAETRGYK